MDNPTHDSLVSPSSQPRILIVDDDAGLASLLERSLAREGYSVETAGSGEEAFNSLLQRDADLVLLDLRLPDMNGRELIRRLEQQGRIIPFITITGAGDERSAVEMMKFGAQDYLIKDQSLLDFVPSVVHQTVRRLRQQKRLAEAETALQQRLLAERDFLRRLTVLHEVSAELVRTTSLEELCRKTVELGHNRLGFDRMGIWFVTDDSGLVEGTFGIDEKGRLRDERGKKTVMYASRRELIATNQHVGIIREYNRELHDDQSRTVGTGDLAWTGIWDGQKNIGLFSLDNFLSKKPITDQDCELFSLYASTLGHLCLRQKALEALQASESRYRTLSLELDQRVQQRTAELSAVNEELQAFCYSVSHDLRAPLRAIDGFSRAVWEDYKDHLDENGNMLLQRIRAASQRMAMLIDDLLKLSRMSRAEMVCESVNLAAIARNVNENLQASAPDRNVEFIAPAELIDQADPRLIRITLENLLGNAWKFTGKKDHARIEFGMKVENDQKVYYLKDNGAGFDMTFVDRLFGAFQRLHAASEFEGSGIGLATVQRIIHRHGGRIWAEGEPQQGATFYFTLCPAPVSSTDLDKLLSDAREPSENKLTTKPQE